MYAIRSYYATDMMFESTHFPEILTPFQIGMRVVTANVSDIAAMCAKPLGMVISMGFNKPDSAFIDEMSKGINYISKEYECRITSYNVCYTKLLRGFIATVATSSICFRRCQSLLIWMVLVPTPSYLPAGFSRVIFIRPGARKTPRVT